MSWLKTHRLGALSAALSAASLAAGIGIGRIPVGAPSLALPAEVQAEPGDLVKVHADGSGAALYWDVQPKLPAFTLDAERALLVSAKTAGRYTVTCETARGGKIARAACVVTVGAAPPPEPNPPVPPDPFTASVQTAFAAEADAQKADQAKLLAALYRGAANSTVKDPSLKSTADLLATMQTARKALLPDAALPKVRDAIRAELNKSLADVKSLDDATRTLCGRLFGKVAQALEDLR